MPKSVDIEDFAAKLALVAKRLNWSRAKLAQQVGVDKSLVARWFNSVSRPTEHSLMRLTSAVARTLEELTNADWELPLGQFALRIGLKAADIPLPSDSRTQSRLTIGGLKFPPVTEFGEPYLGLWAGLFQSVVNRGVPRLCAARFTVDDLGLRLSFTEGSFRGEGPALASRSHLQCLIDVAPLYDRMAFFVFNGVHSPSAFVIDGVVNVMAGDSAGTPTAIPMVLFRIDDGVPADMAPSMDVLDDAVNKANTRATDESTAGKDPMAVVRELFPTEVLKAIYPVVGVAHDDGLIDYTLRVPPARSLAVGSTGVNPLLSISLVREVSANLRRVLGLDRTRPQLRVLSRLND